MCTLGSVQLASHDDGFAFIVFIYFTVLQENSLLDLFHGLCRVTVLAGHGRRKAVKAYKRWITKMIPSIFLRFMIYSFRIFSTAYSLLLTVILQFAFSIINAPVVNSNVILIFHAVKKAQKNNNTSPSVETLPFPKAFIF